MKTSFCVFMGLVVTVPAVHPVKGVYLGTLHRSFPYTLEVQGTTQISITILSVTEQGKLEVEDVLVMDGNVVILQSRTIPNNVQRQIFKIDVPVNSTGLVKISQGPRWEIPVDGHQEAVFDVAP